MKYITLPESGAWHHSAITFGNAIWILTAILPLLIVARLAYLGLVYKPPHDAACVFLCAIPLIGIPRAFVPQTQHEYTLVWQATLPLLLFAHAWACVRTYQSIIRLYPKIGRYGRSVFVTCLTVAALCSVAAIPLELSWFHPPQVKLRAFFLTYQIVDGICGFGLLLLVGYFARLPNPLLMMPRNLSRHTWLLTAYFVSYAVVAFFETRTKLGHPVMMIVERGHFLFVAALYVIWTFALSRRGEETEEWVRG